MTLTMLRRRRLLEFNWRTGPGVIPQSRSAKGIRGRAPALAGVAARPPSPEVQQRFAQGVEPKECQDIPALLAVRSVRGADEFVILHTPVGQSNGTPRLDPNAGTQRQARAEDDCVQQIALKSDVGRDGTVIEGARQGGNEIHVAGRTSFNEAAALHLNYHLDFNGCFI